MREHYDWLPIPVIAYDDGGEVYRNPAAAGLEVGGDMTAPIEIAGRWYDVRERTCEGAVRLLALVDVTAAARLEHIRQLLRGAIR